MDFGDLIGRSAPFNTARDVVNLPMIRHWCDVVGVRNPRYLDPESAVAPIAMLDVWDKPGLTFVRDEANPQGAALTALDGAGFTSTVAVNSDLEQVRPLRLGELVHSTLTLEDISPEKQTGLGVGHFVTSRIRYLVGDEVVGSVLFRVLKFRPGTGTPASGVARPAPPPAAEGALPPLAIPLTPTLIIGGALMTLDWFDAHHDRDMAVQRGSKDIFMNIHTTLGLVQRYVEDWAGPDVEWRTIKARLGASNHPGDTMVLSGNVVGAAGGVTTVAYRGMNSLGAHVTGTADLVLP
jgi:hypothetical protein